MEQINPGSPCYTRSRPSSSCRHRRSLSNPPPLLLLNPCRAFVCLPGEPLRLFPSAPPFSDPPCPEAVRRRPRGLAFTTPVAARLPCPAPPPRALAAVWSCMNHPRPTAPLACASPAAAASCTVLLGCCCSCLAAAVFLLLSLPCSATCSRAALLATACAPACCGLLRCCAPAAATAAGCCLPRAHGCCYCSWPWRCVCGREVFVCVLCVCA